MIAFEPNWIQQRFPEYSYLSTLNSGGQKDVCLIYSKTKGNCVLKIVNPNTDLKRIEREIQTVCKHHFSNVPEIYETGTVEYAGNKLFFIIEQYISGSNLRKLISRSALPCLQVQSIVHQLLLIVVELERKNVVHRDIKPENVILDCNGKVWLIDFGIVLDCSQTALTAPSARYAPLCTLGYAAPEQIRNLKADISSKSDLFAIGVMAFELLTQHHPLRDNAAGQLDILYRTENMQLPPVPPSFNVPSEFDQFIHWLAERWPSRRPESAVAALKYFQQNFLGGK